MFAYAILFLFAFQLISDFVESIYAFGLLGTDIPPEIATVLFFLAPALLLILRKGLSRRGVAVTGGVILAATLVEVMLDTRGRMLVSGLGVGAFFIWLPSLIGERGRSADAATGPALGAGLTLGLAFAMAARAWHSGVDPSGEWPYCVILLILALVAAAAWLRPGARAEHEVEPELAPPAGFLWVTGLSVGMIAVLALLYFAFAAPNVIARWTGANYLLVLTLLMLALTTFAAWLGVAHARVALRTRTPALVGSLLFVAALVATLLAHQPGFPSEPGGYPFFAPNAPQWATGSLVLLCVLFPVILLDFGLYADALIRARPTNRALAAGFLIAAAFFLVMVFAHVFTTVYDYIPVVGPLFRDRFWIVYLVLGLAAVLPLLLIRKDAALERAPSPAIFAAATAALGLALVAGALFTAASPAAPPAGRTGLRILTFNIQQGYDARGQRGYAGQLALARQVDADIIGLQESDTNRISGGNADIVRYFADQLDMHSYYGPNTVAGTFGIALLSRYPIENPRTFYMYSTGEQTAAIAAQITVGDNRYDIFVTHLGNGGPIVQQRAFLSEVSAGRNVIAMGDFNFRPDTEQYRLTTQTLEEAWLLKWPGGVDAQGFDPARRIDYVFVSPGTGVRDARFLTGPESDHPALVVEIGR